MPRNHRQQDRMKYGWLTNAMGALAVSAACLLGVGLLTTAITGCAVAAGAAAGGAAGYVAGHEAGEDEVRDQQRNDDEVPRD